MSAVLLGVKACMIYGLPFDSAPSLAGLRTGSEHKHAIACQMPGKNLEHILLSYRREMEEAVPCEDGIKDPPEVQPAHIRGDNLAVR